MVAKLFIPNPDNLPEVNHVNGNRTNNCVSNLEWCDRAYNEREARRVKIKEYKPYYIILNNGIKKE